MMHRFGVAGLAALPLALAMTGALTLSARLGLGGWQRWVFFGVISLMGALISWVLFRILTKLGVGQPKTITSGPIDELRSIFKSAQKNLSGSSAEGRAALGDLPMVLVLGPPGSGKTTAVLNSGMAPELLAGDVFRGDQTIPTQTANVWYADQTVFLEVGGGVLEDRDLWTELLKLVQPRRLLAAIGAKNEAPRVAVVCLDASEVAVRGADLTARARALRTPLIEASQALGVPLPVYVLFTKMDAVPHFSAFVRNLTDEESGRILGATLPTSDLSQVASYAEHEARRFGQSFSDLHHSLALKRPRYLGRERDKNVAGAAYQFPREFNKIASRAVPFLVELCRPSQLKVSPFVRGFYLVGERDVAPTTQATPRQAAPVDVDATLLFNPAEMMASAPRPTPRAGGKEPIFLRRLFRELILRDPLGAAASTGGTRVRELRQIGLGLAALVVFLAFFPLLSSHRNNRALKNRVTSATTSLRGLGVPTEDNARDILTHLDSARAVSQWLVEHEDDPPFGYDMGLYVGDRLREETEASYFRALQASLFGPTHEALVSELERQPATPEPDSDYRRSYDALRAYLVSTQNAERSDSAFMGRTLRKHWPLNGSVEGPVATLAQRQFGYLGLRLPDHDPYRLQNDPRLVTKTRRFLQQMGAAQPFYVALANEISATQPPLTFPYSAPLIVPSPMEYAYTDTGWNIFQTRLEDPEALLNPEPWVIGEDAPLPDPAELVGEIRQLYEADYRRRWIAALESSSIEPLGDARSASRLLDRLLGDDLELHGFIYQVANQAYQPSDPLQEAYKPLGAWVVTDSTAAPFDDQTAEASDYIDALQGVRQGVTQLAEADGAERLAVAGDLRRELQEARRAAGILGRNATRLADGGTEAARVVAAFRRLIDGPINQVQALTGGIPRRHYNELGREFCRRYNELVGGKYPISSSSELEASIPDLQNAFQPQAGEVWSLVTESLSGVVVRRGREFREADGSPIDVSPRFLNFLTSAHQFGEAIFRDGGEVPRVTFSIQPQEGAAGESFRLTIDDERVSCEGGLCGGSILTWVHSEESTAEVSAGIGGRTYSLGSWRGPWAVFRMFSNASGWRGVGAEHPLRWSVPTTQGQSMSFVTGVGIAGATPPVFDPGWLRGLTCVSQISR